MTANGTGPDTPRAQPQSPLDLYLSFTALALQGFGGVLVVVQRELVERKRWMTREEFVEEWAVAQILPGPNVINLALMIGDRYFGLRGALAGLAGILSVPLIIVLMLASVYSQFSDSPRVVGALDGMAAVAAGLITATGVKLIPALARNAMGRLACVVIGAATFVGIAWLRWPLAWVVLGVGIPACVWAWVSLTRAEGQEPLS